MSKHTSRLDSHTSEKPLKSADHRPKLRLSAYAPVDWDEAYDEFMDHVAASFEESTYRLYKVHLGAVMRWMQAQGISLVEFTARDLDRYLAWRKEQPSKRRPVELPQEFVDYIASDNWGAGSLDHWAAKLGVEKSTIKRYRSMTDRGLTSHTLAPSWGDPVVKQQEIKISDSTRRKEALCTRMFAEFCYMRNILDKHVLKDYKIPADNKTLPKMPTDGEVDAFLEAINRMWNPRLNPHVHRFRHRAREFHRTRNIAIIAGCKQTGARISEILALTLADYDAENLMVTFRDTKTNTDRSVPIMQSWADMVSEYLKWRPKLSTAPTLFVAETGEEVTVDAWEKVFRRARDFANQCQRCHGTGKSMVDAKGRPVILAGRGWERLPKDACRECGGSGKLAKPIVTWSMHGLRHLAATKLCARSGVDAAQEILGHTSIISTQRYNHLSQERLRAAIEAANHCEEERPIIVNKRSQANRKRRLV